MTSSNCNNMFLSQRIVQQTGAPPMLRAPSHRQGSAGSATLSNNKPTQDTILQGYYQEANKETNEPVIWQWRIEASMIPSLSVYYTLEPTSITLKQIPLSVVESRMSNFLRIQSISYTYDAHSARLDCVTSDMLKFVVQFWRVGGGPKKENFEHPNRALTVELQRRQGSVVDMLHIRKMMFRALLTGEEPTTPSEEGRLRPLPDLVMAEVDAGANYDHDAGREDAFEIALRLLESRCIDQIALGLESLKMLTDPSIVSQQDAVFTCRAIVFREGEYGERLQAALASYFGAAATSARPGNMEQYEEDTRGQSMALAILASALQLLVSEHETACCNQKAFTIDPSSAFWAAVGQTLYFNVERAMTMPHEGAMSAKCIRLLNSLQNRLTATPPQIPTTGLRSCLTQAHQYGQRYHLSLERESQKLLAMDTDTFLCAH